MKINNQAFIALGGNLGDVQATFAAACELIASSIGPILVRSSIYRTKALLPPEQPAAQPDYLNAVVLTETFEEPRHILDSCLAIEAELGRLRDPEKRWQPRAIDLDLLAFGDLIINEPGLILPHPALHLRDFVLQPLCEIAPGWRHPVLNVTVSHILESVNASSPSSIISCQSFAGSFSK